MEISAPTISGKSKASPSTEDRLASLQRARQVEPVWGVEPSGLRRSEGQRLRDMISLEVMVAQAKLRHDARHASKAPEDRPTFVAPFTPSQISVARSYRDLVEWREGSAMRGTNLLGAGGGGGSGEFIDSYIENGRWLEILRERVGGVVVMDIRRNMDRGNARRTIIARAALDMVVLAGLDLSGVLMRHGWTADGKNRKALRGGLCAALDRMAGPVCGRTQVWQDAAVCAQSGDYRHDAS